MAKKVYRDSSFMMKELKRFLAGATVTLFASMCILAYLAPFFYTLSTSLKDQGQISHPKSPLWPATTSSFEYEGEFYDLYEVEVEGEIKQLALINKGREQSEFVDPQNAAAGLIVWEGKWRQLEPVWNFSPRFENYKMVWNLEGQDFTFMRWLFNSFAIAAIGIIGTLVSCLAVAYGFSRFRIPGKNILFIILVATIFLPRTVITVPLYAVFTRIGWVGTWLPLIVPHFFANAYNVFWMRQYFMTIPREMDEAAMIDGAGPLRILFSVIIPQAWPAIVSTALFHMVFAWKDFFEPLIYLSTKPELQPISVGIQQFNALYGQKPHLIQTAAILGLAVPVLIFFFAQRVFMQGMVFTGVEK
jgi:multiple sugar transport system permease protein